jgi:hypothetical protein
VARDPAVRLVIAVSAAVTFTSASFLVVEPLYARHVLHRPPSQFALFEAAAGTGAILAGLVVSRIRLPHPLPPCRRHDPDGRRYRVRPGRMPVHRYHLTASRLYRLLLVGRGRVGVRRDCGHYTPGGRPDARARPGS